ncbi:TRAP transporter small permease [Mesorhizobium xinjiangense]|uniref:TRAP transporter small permease n=1 Tax=Mesorhizobium xinjiangense TaxID=2678685 RepID=UPI0012EE17D0|nr:TRAP transporter small permease [Mesorhizobium xinjiangense]
MLPLRMYNRFIPGLAALGALSLVFITAAIIVDVVLRNTGFRPFLWTSAVVEYVMLFSTMAAAPWLVRTNGHVAISSFIEIMPPSLRLLAGRAMLLIAILTLALLCWRSAAVGLQMVASRAVDMRSINIPSWVLYAMLSGGFGLMALEFLRLLLRGETYSGTGGGH